MTSHKNILKTLAIGLFLYGFSNVQATTNTVDQAALQGYIGESVSQSPSFQVNSTVGILNQTIIFDAPVTTPPTTPILPSKSRNENSSGSDGGEKYSASNWILKRKYDQLVEERDRGNEDLYTSAPKEEPEIFDEKPLLPNEDIDPITEITKTRVESIPEIDPPRETETNVVIQKPIISQKESPKNTQTLDHETNTLQESLNGAFVLQLEQQKTLNFDQNKCSTSAPHGMLHFLFWHILPWILILLLILYGGKKRKEYKKTLEELENTLKKNKE